MTTADEPRREDAPREGIVSLARQLVTGIIQLARLEITRGRQEIGEMLAETRTGLVMIAIGVGLVVLALFAFVAFIILAIAALTGLPEWLMALLVFFVLGLLAALLAWRGVMRIHIGPPEETIESVKEDIAWAKRLLRRE